ncbi:hypothetical protein VDGL01_11238 [Verticillium dahliae]
MQYATAKELGYGRVRCGAVGNLGMVTYQLYLKSNKEELLEEAFSNNSSESTMDTDFVAEASLVSLDLSRLSKDPTVIAMSHFFCGHALWLNRQRDEAFKRFNNYDGCTPTIDFYKESSEENLRYLQELVEVGVDIYVLDEHGL